MSLAALILISKQINTMDYLEIVLNGYFNKDNRADLPKYFVREFKRAAKEDYDAEEFFSACLRVIERWVTYLDEKMNERKREVNSMLLRAKSKKEIRDFKEALAEISINNYTVHLNSLTNARVSYSMPYNEVLQIKNAINEAYQKASAPQQSELAIGTKAAKSTKIKLEDNNYSPKEINIAYLLLSNESVTAENAAEILRTYSQTKSVAKFLAERISQKSELTRVKGDKTADTKHFNSLKRAEQLLSGKKDNYALSEIRRIITAFETNYKNKY